MPQIHLTTTVPSHLAGKRLDQVLAALWPDYSRAQWQRWINAGCVTVNEKPTTLLRHKMRAEDKIQLLAELVEQAHYTPQNLGLNIIYEDESLIIVNKPAGLVVHPAAGNPDHTLVNALLHDYPELAQLPRGGLIHRLDKDTTGLLVVARQLPVYHELVQQLQQRHIHREYYCIVQGRVISGGTINAPLGRHPTQRKRRAVVLTGKQAITHYRVMDRFAYHTGLQVILETGRTHQIRVHLAHQHFPILGDPVYGGRKIIPKDLSLSLQNSLRHWKRQALHAKRLQLTHPVSKQLMEWQAPLPEDLENLRQQLLAEKK